MKRALLACLVLSCGSRSQSIEATAEPVLAPPPPQQRPAPPDPGPLTAPPPEADDPATCAQPILPHPELRPWSDHPCTQIQRDWQERYRYDSTGRLVWHEHLWVAGTPTHEQIFSSTDDGDTRTDLTTDDGAVTERDVSHLEDGFVVWEQLFGGDQQLKAEYTFNYAPPGRLVSVLRDGAAEENDFYDEKGRLYYQLWTSCGEVSCAHPFRLRSWFANGQLKEDHISYGGDPEGWGRDDRFDACGNQSYSANVSINGRYSGWSTWTWDNGGLPATRSDVWTDILPGWSSVETYSPDGSGRVASSVKVITNPQNRAAPMPPTTTQHLVYQYDAQGHTIERLVDGASDFHARFDDRGRITELSGPSYVATTWTYDGCGR